MRRAPRTERRLGLVARLGVDEAGRSAGSPPERATVDPLGKKLPLDPKRLEGGDPVGFGGAAKASGDVRARSRARTVASLALPAT